MVITDSFSDRCRHYGSCTAGEGVCVWPFGRGTEKALYHLGRPSCGDGAAGIECAPCDNGEGRAVDRVFFDKEAADPVWV